MRHAPGESADTGHHPFLARPRRPNTDSLDNIDYLPLSRVVQNLSKHQTLSGPPLGQDPRVQIVAMRFHQIFALLWRGSGRGGITWL